MIDRMCDHLNEDDDDDDDKMINITISTVAYPAPRRTASTHLQMTIISLRGLSC